MAAISCSHSSVQVRRPSRKSAITPSSQASSARRSAWRYSSSSKNSRGRPAGPSVSTDSVSASAAASCSARSSSSERASCGSSPNRIERAAMNSGYSPSVPRSISRSHWRAISRPGVGDRVLNPVRVALDAGRLRYLDEPVSLQPLDRLIEARPGPHVDHAVLALGLEQLLHPIHVHRLVHQLPQDSQGESRAAGSLGLDHGQQHTRQNMTSQNMTSSSGVLWSGVGSRCRWSEPEVAIHRPAAPQVGARVCGAANRPLIVQGIRSAAVFSVDGEGAAADADRFARDGGSRDLVICARLLAAVRRPELAPVLGGGVIACAGRSHRCGPVASGASPVGRRSPDHCLRGRAASCRPSELRNDFR